jgi:hypothetical protein
MFVNHLAIAPIEYVSDSGVAGGLCRAVDLEIERDLAVREQVAAVPVRAHAGACALLCLLLAEPAIDPLAGACEAPLDQHDEESGDRAAVLEVGDR